MKVLALNCGSSSVKFKLVEMDREATLASGLVEEIGSPRATVRYSGGGGPDAGGSSASADFAATRSIGDHETAIREVLRLLADPERGRIRDLSEIAAVGHRVVHGADAFRESVLIDGNVVEAIRECIPFAPLHNPHNLRGIEVAAELLPGVPQVAAFDTAFHCRMPAEAREYALPSDVRRRLGIKRYGFHGISHAYVSEEAARMLGRGLDELRLVTCHLGNGASVAAVDRGVSVDTSMGMTPLEGLVMGTRSGDLDPSIVLHLQEAGGYSTEDVRRMLNEESGLLGLSGSSSDMRSIIESAEAGDPDATLAFRVFCRRARKYVGAYTAVMGGLDAVVFTGGIGENEPSVRDGICLGLEFMGVELSASSNLRGAGAVHSGRVAVLVIHTDEETAIAREAGRVVSAGQP